MDFVIYFAVLFTLFASTGHAVTVEILKSNKTGVDAALIIVPGAKISGPAYRPLAEEIQNRSSLNLWVALLDGFFDQLPNPIQLKSAFKKAVSQLQQAGYKGKKVLLAGHSLGGSVCASYGQKTNQLLAGVLLFSAYLTKGHLLKDYPVPVLTISGDLDGLTRTTRIVDTFEELKNDAADQPDQKYKTPVIVMEGITHAQFASGTMPPNVREHDLNPEVSATIAYETIANYTNAFLVSVLNSSDVTEARALLDGGFNKTAAILQPLAAVKSIDQNDEWVSHWTNTAQELIVSLQNTTDVQFVNYEDESQAITRPSKLAPDIQIVSFTTLWLTPNPLDVTTSPLSPLQLKATMKSQEAVKKVFPNRPFGTPATCKEINQAAFTMAFSQSSTTAKNRYSSRGRPIRILDDQIITSELQWLRTSLQLIYNTTGLFVTASRHQTSVDSKFYSTAGQDDCTLLSPFRAMEWIYIDSLKYTKP